MIQEGKGDDERPRKNFKKKDEGFQHSKHRSWCKIVTKRKAKKKCVCFFSFCSLFLVPFCLVPPICSFFVCVLLLECRSCSIISILIVDILDVVRVASSPTFHSWSPEFPRFLLISFPDFALTLLRALFCMIFSFNNIVSSCSCMTHASLFCVAISYPCFSLRWFRYVFCC